MEAMERVERSVWLDDFKIERSQVDSHIEQWNRGKFKYETSFPDDRACIITFDDKKGLREAEAKRYTYKKALKSFMEFAGKKVIFNAVKCGDVIGFIWKVKAQIDHRLLDTITKNKIKVPGVEVNDCTVSGQLILLLQYEEKLVELLHKLQPPSSKEQAASATPTKKTSVTDNRTGKASSSSKKGLGKIALCFPETNAKKDSSRSTKSKPSTGSKREKTSSGTDKRASTSARPSAGGHERQFPGLDEVNEKVFVDIYAKLVPWASCFYVINKDDVSRIEDTAKVTIKAGIISAKSLESLKKVNELIVTLEQQRHGSKIVAKKESSDDGQNVIDKDAKPESHKKGKNGQSVISREVRNSNGRWEDKTVDAGQSKPPSEVGTNDFVGVEASVDDKKSNKASLSRACAEPEESYHSESKCKPSNRDDSSAEGSIHIRNHDILASGDEETTVTSTKEKNSDGIKSEDSTSVKSNEEDVESEGKTGVITEKATSSSMNTESTPTTANTGAAEKIGSPNSRRDGGDKFPYSPGDKESDKKKRGVAKTLGRKKPFKDPDMKETGKMRKGSLSSKGNSLATPPSLSDEVSDESNGRKGRAKKHDRTSERPSSNTAISYDIIKCLEEKHLETTSSEGVKVSLYVGDITKEKTDVIVNAANGRLRHGGGVSKAIVDAGGVKIQRESNEYIKKNNILIPGQFCHTSAGKLKSRYIVHAVGPKWKSMDGDQAINTLHQMLVNLFNFVGSKLEAKSLASPAISTGQYGMPLEVCAKVFDKAIKEFSAAKSKSNLLKEIHVVLFDEAAATEFIMAFAADHSVEKRKLRRKSSSDLDRSSPKDMTSSRKRASSEKKGKFSADVKGAVGGITSFPALSTHDIADPCKNNGDCDICADEDVQLMSMKCCQNTFCRSCFKRHFRGDSKCPFCTVIVLLKEGNQPEGDMSHQIDLTYDLPGHEGDGMIVIDYVFRNGLQQENHPNPGFPYSGTHRRAFLPASKEGKYILKLLRKAFDMKYLFTIGKSVTTGRDNCVVWNDIHHKTNIDGGAGGYGYPDPTYLSRVREELAAKGIK